MSSTQPAIPYKEVLSGTLGEAYSHETLNLLRHLYDAHPTSKHVPVVEYSDTSFPLSRYLESQGVTVTLDMHLPRSNLYSGDGKAPRLSGDTYLVYGYDGRAKQLYPDVIAGRSTFTYNGTSFIAYKATWSKNRVDFYFFDLVMDSEEAGKKLAENVYVYGATLKEEIWVYQSGEWAASKPLYKAVQAASWDDVVLEDTFKEGLRRDTKGFFESKEIYDDLETIWKRGILLLGPPGNGKTESIKALLKETDYPALYVKSFTTPYGPEYGVRSIFNHARRHAPCILVLEDLDAMVVPKVRSFFLNELDGLAANQGILTIATTNHPERIDDAIVNRPSRFDVKYNFSLPDVELRRAFARKWIGKFGGSGTGGKDKDVKPATRAKGVKFEMEADELAAKVAEMTEGFSFAFLKELFVSFLLSLAHSRSNEHQAKSISVDDLLLEQIEKLSKQIIKKSEKVEKGKKEGEEKGDENKEEEPNEPDSCWSPPEPTVRDSSQTGPTF